MRQYQAIIMLVLLAVIAGVLIYNNTKASIDQSDTAATPATESK